MAKRGVRILRNGEWIEAAPSPQLLPEHMRELPADMVTKDPADPDRVHELDPDYVVHELVDIAKQKQAVTKQDPLKAYKYREAPRDAVVPLSQEQVDFVRFRIIKARVDSAVALVTANQPVDLKVKHVWFPRNNINEYEMRDGNAPPNSMRPKHLRNLDLAVDLFDWPRAVKDILREGGHKVPNPERMWDDMVMKAKERAALDTENG